MIDMYIGLGKISTRHWQTQTSVKGRIAKYGRNEKSLEIAFGVDKKIPRNLSDKSNWILPKSDVKTLTINTRKVW